MARPPSAVVLAALLVLAPASPAADKDASPRTDSQGDPLPPGALLRLGTVRWRACARFLAFLPDGKTLLTGEMKPEPVIRLWDVVTGKETGHFPGPHLLRGFALSPDGATLALSSGGIFFVSVPDGKELRRIETPSKYFDRLCFSPDGKCLAGIDNDTILHIWDAANGKELLREHEKGEGYDTLLTFSPDSTKLSVSCRIGGLHMLEVATGKVLLKRERTSEYGWGTRAFFSPDGKKFLWEGEDYYSFALRDASTGAPLLSFRDPEAILRPVAFSPDGKRIASRDEANYVPDLVGLWDAATGKELRKLKAPGAAFWPAEPVFSPDGKRLASSGDYAGVLHVWDVETGKDLAEAGEHQSIVCSVAFSPDGRTVFTGCADNVLRVWDADKGTVVRRIEVHEWNKDPEDIHIAFSKDRRVAVITDVATNASLWDLDSGKKRVALDGGENPARLAEFAPDGKTLASRDIRRPGIQFWDAATGKKESRIVMDESGYEVLAISPDGKTLVVERNGGELELVLWDVASGEEIRKWPLPDRGTDVLRFEPAGSIIAGAVEGGVDLWDVGTGQELPALRMPKDAPAAGLRCLAFSSDGRTLAAGSTNGTIYLWEVSTAKLRAVLVGHRDRVASLDFSPDGARLISGSHDTTALIWDLTGLADEKGPKTLTPERLASLWDDLADADAGKAWRAAWRLAADPAASVPFLAKRLRPAEVDADRIARLLASLDADDFESRETASRELAKLGELAGPAVRRALDGKPSPEARRRLEELARRLGGPVDDADEARALRGVEALEHMGTAEARRLLGELAGGTEGSRLTREAKAALDRLAGRPSGPP